MIGFRIHLRRILGRGHVDPNARRSFGSRSRWRGVLAALLVSLSSGPNASADIVIGPWTFDDDALADDAIPREDGLLSLWCATDLDDALTGFSPEKQIVNIGFGDHANHFQLDFLDLMAVNAKGADLVFFNAQFSTDSYEIAVRPVGDTFTEFIAYYADDFISTGEDTCEEAANGTIYGLAFDLDDFGLSPGTLVDAIQFRALDLPDQPFAEGDPVMAAVLSQGCTPTDDDGEPDCNDSNPCTTDECVDGVCRSLPVDCSDFDDLCNTASCDPNGADGNCDVLTPLPDGTSCDDGDACNGSETCLGGTCQAGTPLGCDDNNLCTDDDCHPVAGCVNIPVGCNDEDACTEDGCDSDTGCTHQDIECPKGQVCDPASGECVEEQDPCECVNGRVTLCHIPPGNLANARTITVGCAARDKHLAHGDFCGPCE
ncbi:MAG: hypothetical protein IID41_04340 [Planctomycetes bacterium]|nr:hypothetical protein [Planctomycetota bacterium]